MTAKCLDHIHHLRVRSDNVGLLKHVREGTWPSSLARGYVLH